MTEILQDYIRILQENNRILQENNRILQENLTLIKKQCDMKDITIDKVEKDNKLLRCRLASPTSNVYDDVTSDVTGDVTSDVTGDVSSDVSSDVASDVYYEGMSLYLASASNNGKQKIMIRGKTGPQSAGGTAYRLLWVENKTLYHLGGSALNPHVYYFSKERSKWLTRGTSHILNRDVVQHAIQEWKQNSFI